MVSLTFSFFKTTILRWSATFLSTRYVISSPWLESVSNIASMNVFMSFAFSLANLFFDSLVDTGLQTLHDDNFVYVLERT